MLLPASRMYSDEVWAATEGSASKFRLGGLGEIRKPMGVDSLGLMILVLMVFCV